MSRPVPQLTKGKAGESGETVAVHQGWWLGWGELRAQGSKAPTTHAPRQMKTYNATEVVRDLADWSDNCERPTPFGLFLDLVGWSEETFGCTVCDGQLPNLGYVEAGKLAAALEAWSDRPRDVETAIAEVMGQED